MNKIEIELTDEEARDLQEIADVHEMTMEEFVISLLQHSISKK